MLEKLPSQSQGQRASQAAPQLRLLKQKIRQRTSTPVPPMDGTAAQTLPRSRTQEFQPTHAMERRTLNHSKTADIDLVTSKIHQKYHKQINGVTKSKTIDDITTKASKLTIVTDNLEARDTSPQKSKTATPDQNSNSNTKRKVTSFAF